MRPTTSRKDVYGRDGWTWWSRFWRSTTNRPTHPFKTIPRISPAKPRTGKSSLIFNSRRQNVHCQRDIFVLEHLSAYDLWEVALESGQATRKTLTKSSKYDEFIQVSSSFPVFSPITNVIFSSATDIFAAGRRREPPSRSILP